MRGGAHSAVEEQGLGAQGVEEAGHAGRRLFSGLVGSAGGGRGGRRRGDALLVLRRDCRAGHVALEIVAPLVVRGLAQLGMALPQQGGQAIARHDIGLAAARRADPRPLGLQARQELGPELQQRGRGARRSPASARSSRRGACGTARRAR